MKIFSKASLIFLTVAIVAGLNFFLDGCKYDAPSLFDPGTAPQPIVDSLSPAGGALAGIDTIRVYGKNFSANPADDGVYFNATLVNNTGIIQASTTMLTLKAPAISGDTIFVRVFVIGAVDFSPTVRYSMKAAIDSLTVFASGEGGYGLSLGSDGNLYASLSNANLSVKDEGIFRINADGTIQTPAYILPTTSPVNQQWPAFKFGPSNAAYAVKGSRAVYKLVPGQSNPGGTPWAVFPSGAINDLDFDPGHNLWMGGSGLKTGADTTNIVMATLTPTTQTYHFPGTVRSVRYFDGYLYFAATVEGVSQVWRASVSGTTLGTPEVYFDASTAYSGAVPTIYAIAFSAGGDMYVGLDGPDYLIIVHANGVIDKPYSLYVSSGVLYSACKAFAWVGTTLYATTATGTLLRIATGQQSAPYYGVQ